MIGTVVKARRQGEYDGGGKSLAATLDARPGDAFFREGAKHTSTINTKPK